MTNVGVDTPSRQSDFQGLRPGALHASEASESPAGEEFGHITRMAQRLLGVETAMVSLADDSHCQDAHSHALPSGGPADAGGAPMPHFTCMYPVTSAARSFADDLRGSLPVPAHTAAGAQELIPDAAPSLRASGGHVLGSLCVGSKTPRAWSPMDLLLLEELTTLVGKEIEYRRQRVEVAQIHSMTERLPGPIVLLGDAVRSAADLAAKPSDPRLPRMTSSARSRMSAIEIVVGDLVNAANAARHHAAQTVQSIDLRDRLLSAVHVATSSGRAEDVDVLVDNAPVRVWLDRYRTDKRLTLLVATALNHLAGGERVTIALHRGTGEARVEVSSPGHAMPIAELLRVVARLDLTPAEGAEPEEATVVSGGHATTVRAGAVSARTGPHGTTFNVCYPVVQQAADSE